MSETKFVAIGHVDTGKSSLCGHLLYKCGYISEHDLESLQRKCSKWQWSRVLDIYEEENVRSKTFEYSTVDFEWEDTTYKLIDTPGHGAFIRSMIQGISSDVNTSILLVSMIENEFESSFERGMLKEHLILARSVGIENLIIVGNKMDLIDWDEKVYNKNIDKVRKFLKKLRWPEEFIHHIPVSAHTGIGLVDDSDTPEWWDYTPLLTTIKAIDTKRTDGVKGSLVMTDTVYAEVFFMELQGMIASKGYQFMVHCGLDEVPAVIEGIKGKAFVKQGEKAAVKISFDEEILVGKGSRIVLRKDTYTIGFGKVFKV